MPWGSSGIARLKGSTPPRTGSLLSPAPMPVSTLNLAFFPGGRRSRLETEAWNCSDQLIEGHVACLSAPQQPHAPHPRGPPAPRQSSARTTLGGKGENPCVQLHHQQTLQILLVLASSTPPMSGLGPPILGTGDRGISPLRSLSSCRPWAAACGSPAPASSPRFQSLPQPCKSSPYLVFPNSTRVLPGARLRGGR